MSEYKLGNITFATEEEYEKAKKELNLIKTIKSKYNLNDPKIAGIILGKFSPETIIGKRFVINLKETVEIEKNSALLDQIDEEIANNTTSKNVVLEQTTRIRKPDLSSERNSPNNIQNNKGQPQEVILNRLQKYDDFCQCKCLDCGYEGMMGVIGYADPNVRRRKKVMIFFAISVPGILISLYLGSKFIGPILTAIVGWIVGLYMKVDQKKLYCPNCDKIIYTQ